MGRWIGLFGLLVCTAAAGVLAVPWIHDRAEREWSSEENNESDEVIRLLDGVDYSTGDYALVVGDFVTGFGDRLLVDEAQIAALTEDLWYRDDSNPAAIVGQGLFTLMGMPPVQRIGALLKDGTTVREFSCLSVVCITWPRSESPDMWGMDGLRGQRESLGIAVGYETRNFQSYDAYLEAHAAVAADPMRWFAFPGGEIPLPEDSGERMILVDLPTEILSMSPDSDWNEGDPTEKEALRVLAEGWVAGTEVRIHSVEVTPRMPFWVLRDGDYPR